MVNKTALIDADSIIYICCANKKKYNEDGTPVIDDLGKHVSEIKTLQQCKDLVDDMLKTILKLTGASHYLMFLTVGKNFRYTIYPTYKGNRKYTDKLDHFDAIKEYIITKYKAIYGHSLEADDLVNIYKKNIPNSFICSQDKDLLLLEGTHYNYRTHQWVTTNSDDAYNHFWHDMVIGQPGDNVKGIEGSGPKAAESIKDAIGGTFRSRVFEAYITKYGEFKGIFEFYKNYTVLKILEEKEGLEILPSIKCAEDEFEERDK